MYHLLKQEEKAWSGQLRRIPAQALRKAPKKAIDPEKWRGDQDLESPTKLVNSPKEEKGDPYDVLIGRLVDLRDEWKAKEQ